MARAGVSRASRGYLCTFEPFSPGSSVGSAPGSSSGAAVVELGRWSTMPTRLAVVGAETKA
jgi:hypothetical protein